MWASPSCVNTESRREKRILLCASEQLLCRQLYQSHGGVPSMINFFWLPKLTEDQQLFEDIPEPQCQTMASETTKLSSHQLPNFPPIQYKITIVEFSRHYVNQLIKCPLNMQSFHCFCFSSEPDTPTVGHFLSNVFVHELIEEILLFGLQTCSGFKSLQETGHLHQAIFIDTDQEEPPNLMLDGKKSIPLKTLYLLSFCVNHTRSVSRTGKTFRKFENISLIFHLGFQYYDIFMCFFLEAT